MPRKQTREEVVERVRKINPNIEMRYDIPYVNMHTRVGWRCIVCGHEFESEPSSACRGRSGCSQCANKNAAEKRRLSKNELYRRIHQYNPNVELLDGIPYVNVLTKARFRCNGCGNTFETIPFNLFRYNACNVCAGLEKKRKLRSAAVEKCHELNPSVEMRNDISFVGVDTKVGWRCSVCGYEWEASVTRFREDGGQCPRCKKVVSKNSAKEEAIRRLHEKYPNVDMLDDIPFENMSTKVRFHCNECNDTWCETPTRCLERGCNVCHGRHRHLTDEEIIAIGNGFDTFVHFHKGNRRVYELAYRRGLLDSLNISRGNNPFSENGDCVYSYEFEKTHSVYVGRTIRKKERDRCHRTSEKSSVFRHALKFGIEIPNMKILVDGISPDDGLRMEDEFVRRYRDAGWNVLNVAKTGVRCGAGASRVRKWTKKKCMDLLKECGSISVLVKTNAGAYNALRRYGVTAEECSVGKLKRDAYTFDEVYEFSLLCSTWRDFTTKYASAYQAALKNGWEEDLAVKPSRHVVKKRYELSDVVECLELRDCKNREDFRTRHRGVYNWVFNNNRQDLLDEYYPRKEPKEG